MNNVFISSPPRAGLTVKDPGKGGPLVTMVNAADAVSPLSRTHVREKVNFDLSGREFPESIRVVVKVD